MARMELSSWYPNATIAHPLLSTTYWHSDPELNTSSEDDTLDCREPDFCVWKITLNYMRNEIVAVEEIQLQILIADEKEREGCQRHSFFEQGANF
jgi:hypothetical protein